MVDVGDGQSPQPRTVSTPSTTHAGAYEPVAGRDETWPGDGGCRRRAGPWEPAPRRAGVTGAVRSSGAQIASKVRTVTSDHGATTGPCVDRGTQQVTGYGGATV